MDVEEYERVYDDSDEDDGDEDTRVEDGSSDSDGSTYYKKRSKSWKMSWLAKTKDTYKITEVTVKRIFREAR